MHKREMGAFRGKWRAGRLLTLAAAAVAFGIAGGQAAPAEAATSRAPLGQFIWWNDEGSSFAQFGANASVVLNTIKFGFVSSCPAGGIGDSFFGFADVYIVPAGSALADGGTLTDVTSTPNTVGPASSAGSLDELIGTTKPAGKLGLGTYAIVIDECQNGKLDSHDAIFDPAFRVQYDPANVPDIVPAFQHLKDLAGAEGASWLQLQRTVAAIEALQEAKAAIECLQALGNCAVEFLIDKMTEKIKEQLMEAFGVVDPVDAAKAYVNNTIQHYLRIKADPPDPAFQQLNAFSAVSLLTSPDTDPLLTAAIELGNAAANEGAVAEGLLRAVERYQGADAAEDGDWALTHARSVLQYADVLAAQLTETKDALAALDAAVTADTRDWDALRPELEAENAELADGFTLSEVQLLRNRGLTEEQIEELEDEIATASYADLSETAAQTAIDEQIAATDAMIAGLATLETNMTSIVSALQAEPLVVDDAPQADAGGPYAGDEGSALTLDGSGSTASSGRSIAEYVWDLDQDGEFDDATGAAPSFTFTADFDGTVGLRVTDNTGESSVGYAPISIASVNAPPSITAFAPTDIQLELALGDSESFSVTSSDPEGDAVTVQWFVDETLAGSGPAFSYTPGAAGAHIVRAVAGDGPAGGSDRQEWSVSVLDEDADGDGWNANADCVDSDSAIPGPFEVVGNSLDDDCDPATPDGGSAPVADFSHVVGAGLVTTFTDESTDVNDDVVEWLWDFGDGTTSTEQSPVHTYATKGPRTVTLTVEDATGNMHTVSRTVGISSAPVAAFTYLPLLPVGGGELEFTDASTDPDPGGSIVSWAWTFGDGGTSIEPNPTHVYLGPGTFTVTLTVTDDDGATGTSTQAIEIGVGDPGTAPQALFKADVLGTNLASAPGGATVVAFSAFCCGGHEPWVMLDDVVGLPWAAPKSTPNNFASIQLIGTADGPRLIDAIQVQRRHDGCCPSQGIITFAVDVSTTGFASADFTQILAGTMVENTLLQTFTLPLPTLAKYVRYRPLTSPDGSWLSTGTFKVMSSSAGPRKVTFENLSTNAVSYKWEFGDGGTSTDAAPTHTYATVGTYTVKLTAKAADGRTSTSTRQYEARGPTASFTAAPAAPIPGEPVALTSTSLFPITSGTTWAWDFGDGTTASAASALHTYAAAGTYTVTLTVTDAEGLSDTVTRSLTVADDPAAPPRAAFNPSSGGKDVAIDEVGGTVLSFTSQQASWPAANVLDGDISTIWRSASGQRTNQSVVVDLAGTRSWTVDQIRLAPRNGAERVKNFTFAVSTTGTADSDFTTVLSATTANNDALQDFPLAAPAQARYVRLTGVDNWGSTCCIGVSELQVLSAGTVVSGRDLALAETGASVAGFSSQNGAGRAPSFLIDDDIASMWTTANGQRTGFVKVDLAGDEPRQLDRVQIAPRNGGERVAAYDLLVSTTTADDAAFTLVHSGTLQNSDALQTILLPTPVSAKYLMLRVLSNRGSTCCTSVSRLRAYTGQEDGRTVVFENDSTRADSYAWDFGDGTTSTEAEPTHTFPGPGTYTVTLTATNANGSTTATLVQVVREAAISLTPAAPEAHQQIDLMDASPAELGLVSWSWDLGNGSTSTFQHPVVTFAALGTYTVRMTGTDRDGRTYTASREIVVGAPSFRAQFHPRGTFNMASLENGAAVIAFSSQLDSGNWRADRLLDHATNTAWHSASGQNSKWIKFSLAGGKTYQIDRFSLLGRQDCCFEQHPRDFEIAVSTTGTADADFKTVLRATLPANLRTPETYVLPRPVLAKYVLYRALNSRNSTVVTTAALRAASGQVNTATVTFDDLTIGGVAPLTYAWNFGDGATSSAASPTHTYPGPGTYPVSVTVTDATGATSSYSLEQKILNAPVVAFTNSPATPNEKQVATFTDQTPSPADAPIVERRWSWGDGTANTNTTAAAATHAFADNGAYDVKLEVQDAWGQVAESTKSVSVVNVAPTVNAGPDWRWREDRALAATPTTADVAGTGDPVTCTWTYGDGTPGGTGCPFSHVYADTGTFTATVTADDGDGGVTTDSFTVEVIEQEVAGGGGGSGTGGGTGVGNTSKDYTYTLDADFELGTMLNVNHESPGNDQLQLNKEAKPFPFVYIANSARGTAVRIDVKSGEILGEFLTSPDGRSRNPSRTTVDKLGNVYVTNRNEGGTLFIDGANRAAGSVTRIGLIVGGTRSNVDGTPNPTGDYMKAPFEYNTCVDRNGDGLIRTSRGLANILPWPNTGGVDHDGGVETAVDECIQHYIRVRGTHTRTVAIDSNNDAWIGGDNNVHEKVDGDTGERVPGTAFDLNCGGYGGLIDRNDVLWSARYGSGLLRYDTKTKTGVCLGNSHGDYGLGVDPVTGHIWHSYLSGDRVVKLDPTKTTAATIEIARYSHGNSSAQGVAVDAKGNVWVAHSLFGATTIGRVRTDGTFLGTASLGGGRGPTGVAVDANGKVWSANENSSTATRVDPEIGQKIASGAAPSGWFDLNVNLGAGAGPYNYSDMTGAIAVGAASPSGFWSIKQDAGALGTVWKRIFWDGSTPGSTSLTIEARAADTQTDLPSTPFVAVGDGALLSGVVGRFIEVRATLQTSDPTATPILTDIRISANTPPVASDGSAETNKDEAKQITLAATDDDGDALTYELVDAPTHGAVSIAGNVATYTPASGYVGPDAFTFKARDASGESNVATVTLNVIATNEPPSAPDVVVSTNEDTPLTILLPATDPDGDLLTIATTDPSHGTYESGVYTPVANYFGPDSFEYTATDPDGESDTGLVTIAVLPVNDPPVAQDVSVTTDEDTPITFALPANDIDDVTLALTADDPPHGTVAVNGALATYTPDPDYHGSDTFTFRATDAGGLSDEGTVSITVIPANDPPTAPDRSVATDEDTPLPIALGGADVDGDTLTVTTTDPAHGTYAGGVYTPDPNYFGPDAFDYTVDDGRGGTDTATVTIDVRPVNDPPVAEDVSVVTDEDTPVSFALPASDVDDPALTLTAGSPSHGTVTIGAGGVATYSPSANYDGPDSFTYTADDGNGGTDSGTVTIDVRPVNDAPVAEDQDVATDEDTPLAITLGSSDVDGGPPAFALATAPQHGSWDGTTYTPAPNYHGPDSFVFLVSDGAGGGDLGTVTITVRPVNDAPAVEDRSVATDEDTPLPIALTGIDVDGDALSFATTDPAHGTYAGGVYTPVPNYNGPDSFEYTASDGNGGTDTATVTIDVRPVNDAPNVDDLTAETNENTPKAIPLTGTDLEGDALTFTWSDPPHGSFDGTTYTPDPNYFGPDSFTYTANDGNGGTDSATVSITVINVNQPPAVRLLAPTEVDEGAAPVQLTAVASDPDGDATLTYAWSAGTGELTPLGATAGYANDDGPRVDTVTVTVSGELTSSASAEILVRNVAPTVFAGPDQIEYWGLPVIFSGSATDPSAADTAAGFVAEWSFGAGTLPVPGLSAGRIYAQPGAYTATLSVSDKDGGNATDSAGVTIEKRPTALAYTGPVSGTYGLRTLSARLDDTADPPTAELGGKEILFRLGARTFTGVTDEDGVATVTAVLPLTSGELELSFTGDERYLPSAASAELTILNGPGKITGGGLRSLNHSGRGGFNVHSAEKGELQWQNATLNFHAPELTGLGVAPDGRSAWFAGIGRDGRAYVAYVEDNGEPGRADVFKLWVGGILQTPGDGRLAGGNVQIHKG